LARPGPNVLKDELVRCGALKFGDFTLTSGKKSKYYVDVKQAITIPVILRQIAKELRTRFKDTEMLAGVELGAVPILVAAALEGNLPYVIIRKGERTHGTGKKMEGPSVKGKRVLIIEDVTTTGNSVQRAVELLREHGALVTRVETIVDRGEGATEALKQLQVELGALVTAQDLLAMSAGARV
jgi:orotate phosphoribosyltransferase